jgi:hypothetical protein
MLSKKLPWIYTVGMKQLAQCVIVEGVCQWSLHYWIKNLFPESGMVDGELLHPMKDIAFGTVCSTALLNITY